LKNGDGPFSSGKLNPIFPCCVSVFLAMYRNLIVTHLWGRICPRLNRKIAAQIPDFELPPDDGTAEFACPLCGKGLSHKSSLKKHVSVSLLPAY
jgi:hypothetical protein